MNLSDSTGVPFDSAQGRPIRLCSGQAFSRKERARNGAPGFVVSAGRVKVKSKIRIKINGKGNGQECPFHTGIP